jgi:hypothetical protein
MRKLALLLVPVLCTAAVVPPSIDSLIDAARGAPGEFAADAMIRLATLERLDKARRVQLLEDAFQRASEAQEPLKRQAVIRKVAGPAGYLNRAYSQNLDAMSLRLRAVEAMLPLDKGKARALFLKVPPVKIPKLACKDFLAYDVGRYYEVLAAIVRETYSQPEIDKHIPLQLLQQQIGAITSAVQIAPAERLVESAASDADFRALLGAFTAALVKISGDDRSFAHAHSLGLRINALADAAGRHDISPLPLLESYRLYLVKNLSGARCADDDLTVAGGGQAFGVGTGAPDVVQAMDAVVYFNNKLKRPGIQEIQATEITAKYEGTAEGLTGCEDKECQEIAKSYKALIMDASNGNVYPPERRKTPEWQDQIRRFLDDMSAWKPGAGASEGSIYREKSGFYADLLGIVPDGPLRRRVVQAMIDYAQRNRSRIAKRIEWLLPMNSLIARMGADPMGMGAYKDEFEAVKDPVIALYFQIEMVCPRPPEDIILLM